MPPLLEPYFSYWSHTSIVGAITLLPKPYFQCQSHNSTYLQYLTITPSTFCLSVGLISVLMPWYLNFRFIHRSSQPLDALIHKPQFIRWSTQSTDALVPKPPVFLLTDSYHTTVYSCKQHHIHNSTKTC
jgi:hypothetical protein